MKGVFAGRIWHKMAEEIVFGLSDPRQRSRAARNCRRLAVFVASGIRSVDPQAFKDRLTYRLSNSAMETLSIIAYKQPITRSEIEEIRGVEVSAVLDTLVERRLVQIAGRRESVGRPLLYGTTPDFLKSFGLKRFEELPSIESLSLRESNAVRCRRTASRPQKQMDSPQ